MASACPSTRRSVTVLMRAAVASACPSTRRSVLMRQGRATAPRPPPPPRLIKTLRERSCRGVLGKGRDACTRPAEGLGVCVVRRGGEGGAGGPSARHISRLPHISQKPGDTLSKRAFTKVAPLSPRQRRLDEATRPREYSAVSFLLWSCRGAFTRRHDGALPETQAAGCPSPYPSLD